MLEIPRSFASAGGLFLAAFAAHALVRLLGIVRPARKRPRGRLYRRRIFDHAVGAYFVLLSLAVAEWRLGLWPVKGALVGLGLLAFLTSALLQWKAFDDLGSAYSPDIELRRDQRLIQTGLYGWVRHPLLAAMLLEVLSPGLVLGAYGSLTLAVLLFFPLVFLRLKEEEKALRGHFGRDYDDYCRRVGALWPKSSWQKRRTA